MRPLDSARDAPLAPGSRVAGQPATRAPRRLSDRSRRREQAPRVRGRAATRRSKLSSIPAWTGAAAGTPKPPASSGRGQIVRQLHEGEWIAAASRRSAARAPARRGGPQDGLEERAGSRDDPAARRESRGSPRDASAISPRGEHHRDPLDREAASREPEHLRRRAIEPLGVVDQAQEGRSRAASDSSPRTASATRNGFGAGPGTEPEGDSSASRCGSRQTLAKRQDRRTELLDRGERELHLALDAGGPDDPERPGPRHRVVEERGLADSRVAMDDERRRHTRRGRTPPIGRQPLARAPGPATATRPHLHPPSRSRVRPQHATRVADYGIRGRDRPGGGPTMRLEDPAPERHAA